MDLEPPSVDDLFALYRLCGGDSERVVELLSRLWSTQPEAIRPTVLAWIGGLPATYKPPSRSRTAPPVLPQWFMSAGQRAAAAARSGRGRMGAAGRGATLALPAGVKPPPLSAPAASGAAASELPRSFDMIALKNAVDKGASKLPQRVDRLALASLPEAATVSIPAAEWMAPRGAARQPPPQPGNGFPARGQVPAAAAPGGVPVGGTFLTGQGGGEDALGAFMYAARMGNQLSLTERASRGMGGRHMR